MSDLLHITAVGRAGRSRGLQIDKFGRRVYRFSLAVNFRHPDYVLWLQCNVYDPQLSHIAERGIIPGERLLVMCDRAEMAASTGSSAAVAWLNVVVSHVQFLVVPEAETIERFGEPREIDYSQLFKKVGA